MGKKGRKIKVMLVCIIILAAAVSFAFASSLSEKETVKDLIKVRTDTLSGFYAGKIEKEDAVEIINNIESDHLLKEDLQNIDLYFQTDIEQVKEYSFKNIKITDSDDYMICADVTMEWEAEGIDGEEVFSVTYDVICQKDGNNFKLVQFF